MGSAPQFAPLTAARERFLGIHAVRIFVRDLDRALQFYLDQLGFRLAIDTRLQSGDRWVAVSPPDGSTVLSLVAPKPDHPEYKLIGRSTPVVFITEDVPATYREWTLRGVKFNTPPRLKRIKFDPAALSPRNNVLLGAESPIWGGVVTRFRDIDGNSFTLVSFDEVTHALEAQRRAEAEKRDAERRVAQELEIARQVQAQLFPQNLPALATLDYAGRCIQARAVGGDYFDFLHLGQRRLGFVVGDVAGKGIAAALLMANLQANLRSLCATALGQPQALLNSVNQLFCENTTDGAYATLFFAEYDDSTGALRYANCGHLSALVLRRDDSLDRLHSNCTVLGLFKDWECCIEECRLHPGDLLALYTDGITESLNERLEEYGEARLVNSLCRHRDQSSSQVLDAVVHDVRQFSPHEQYDDLTLIIAKSRA